MTTGLDMTIDRNVIAAAAHRHGWAWSGGRTAVIVRGPVSIQMIFQPGGALTRAYRNGERYTPFRVSRKARMRAVDLVLYDISAGGIPPAVAGPVT